MPTMTPALPSLQADICLFGEINEDMLGSFLKQKAEAPTDRALVIELSTSGGDADVGRRLAQEIRLWRRGGQAQYFFGKSYVYSAGISIMAAFERERRFLSADCQLLIHERKIQKELRLDGPLKACQVQVNGMLAQIEAGLRLEREGFAELVDGSAVTLADLQGRVCEKDWYLSALEAQRLGLVSGIGQ